MPDLREYMIREYKRGRKKTEERSKEILKEAAPKSTPSKPPTTGKYTLPPRRVGRAPDQVKKAEEKKAAEESKKAHPKGSQQKKIRAVGMTAGAKRRAMKKAEEKKKGD